MATPQLEFFDWASADPNGAIGGLGSVTLTGPMGTAFYFNDNYHGFGSSPPFTPPLPATGMVEIVGAANNAFEVKFGIPLKNPVFYLGSLGSTLTFTESPPVTLVSGSNGFRVEGNKVIGKAFQPPAGSTELTDSNGIVRLTGNFTSVKFTLTPTPGSTIPSDGVFLQIGGTTARQLEFVHWASADPNGATGGLGSVTLTGPMGTAFYFNDNYHGFGSSPPFTPPLPATDMVEIVGAANNAFEVKFGIPLKNPVFYLGSLGSTLTFTESPPVTLVSGSNGFRVEGNKVIGKAFQPPAGSTELTDSNGIVRLTGNFTSVKFTLTPTPGSTIPSDGVFLQIGGTTTQSLATSKSADEMATV